VGGKYLHMKLIISTLAMALCLHQGLLFTIGAASRDDVPRALVELADTERAFVQRAQEVGAKQAFLDYFADTAVGFDTGRPAPAKDAIRMHPDPPKDIKALFWWEPRYGDIAASGELGWLTGPVRSARADRNNGAVRHGNYASIWKRQRDGTFKVVIDVGIDPTAEVPFPEGFTRAPLENRYTGHEIGPLAQSALLAADRALNNAARRSLADAYGAALAPAGRLHRNGRLPMQGRDIAIVWLRTQEPMTGAESLYAEAAQSADLGYTWGSYDSGHYVRVWVREASGAWRVALDVTQPKRAG
jgi:ketosteroid isomerase-like protein